MTGVTFNGNVTFNGPMFDIHDNEHVHIGMEGVGKAKVAEEHSDNVSQKEQEELEGENDTDLIEKIKPVFYNNEDDVRSFLKEISGMKPGDITDLVNRWVKDKRISDYGYSRKGTLWEILNEAGLYTKSRQNWCKRVD